MNPKRLAFSSIVFAALLTWGSAMGATPKAGDKAPGFEGKDQDGKSWALVEHLKKGPVLVYFYPKDDTPGCTKQACGLRDRMGELKGDNVQVVGVSFDSSESHKKFIEKHHLNFTLLADTDGRIADAFGVRIPEKSLARRASFLIKQDGTVTHVTDVPSADTHLAEMKEAVARLKAGG